MAALPYPTISYSPGLLSGIDDGLKTHFVPPGSMETELLQRIVGIAASCFCVSTVLFYIPCEDGTLVYPLRQPCLEGVDVPPLAALAYQQVCTSREAWSVRDIRELPWGSRLQAPTDASEFLSCAAAPMDVGDEQRIGMLCLLDVGVREWTERERFSLQEMAMLASAGTGRAPATPGEASQRFKAELATRKQLEDQLREAQKMESIGQLAGGVAHDFNNLLTVIHCNSEFLLRDLDKTSPHRQDVMEIKQAAERAASLTRQLLAFSRRQILQPKVLDINVVLTDMERLLRRLLGESIELVMQPGLRLGFIEADPSQLEQVILNLAVNARDAMPHGGSLSLTTANVHIDEAYASRHAEVQPGSYVMLTARDTGLGMTESTRERVFEPFFTTKIRGQGTGLGLTTVYSTVRQTGGHILVQSNIGRGTLFTIYLPRLAQDAPTGESVRPNSEPPQGAETILLVEDEPVVRLLASKILREKGYIVMEACNAGEAFLLCERQEGPIHLLLTDIVMPHVNGYELAKRLMQMRGDLRVLFMSAYSEEAIPASYRAGEQTLFFLPKPFSPDILISKVREALGKETEQMLDLRTMAKNLYMLPEP